MRKVATLDARGDKAKVQLGRTAKLKAEADKQASIIRTEIHAGAFYSIETADYTDRQLADMTIATIDVFKKRNNRHDVDWFLVRVQRARTWTQLLKS